MHLNILSLLFIQRIFTSDLIRESCDCLCEWGKIVSKIYSSNHMWANFSIILDLKKKKKGCQTQLHDDSVFQWCHCFMCCFTWWIINVDWVYKVKRQEPLYSILLFHLQAMVRLRTYRLPTDYAGQVQSYYFLFPFHQKKNLLKILLSWVSTFLLGSRCCWQFRNDNLWTL